MVRKWRKSVKPLSFLIIPKCGKFKDLHLSDNEEGGRGGLEEPFISNTPMSSPTRSPSSRLFSKSPLRSPIMKSPLRSPARSRSPISSKSESSANTPRGYLAMYVGERDAEKTRFLVKTHVLNHPLFAVLLNKAKEEFGFEQHGPLTIPCDVAFFQHILFLVQSDDSSGKNAELDAGIVQGQFYSHGR